MRKNGVKHIRTAPYHPASNGEAKRFVQIFKHSLRASKNDEGKLREKLNHFLLRYRNTPHSTTGVTPAELFKKRPLLTRLHLLRPSLRNKVVAKQSAQKERHDSCSRNREFDIGETVLARKLREGPKWVTGTITERTGPIPYRVQVNDQIWRRHTDQLLSSESTIPETVPEVPETLPSVELEVSAPEKVPTPDSRPTDVSTESHESPPTSPTSPKRYPKRNRKPPDRLV